MGWGKGGRGEQGLKWGEEGGKGGSRRLVTSH